MKKITWTDFDCYVSDELYALLGVDGVIRFLEYFFRYEPAETIHWVSEEEANSPVEELLALYTVTNGDIDVLAWPILVDGRRTLALQLQSERPNLQFIDK